MENIVDCLSIDAGSIPAYTAIGCRRKEILRLRIGRLKVRILSEPQWKYRGFVAQWQSNLFSFRFIALMMLVAWRNGSAAL